MMDSSTYQSIAMNAVSEEKDLAALNRPFNARGQQPKQCKC